MNKKTEKLISKAHSNITRIKGREYAPTSAELQVEINKLTNKGGRQ